MRNDAGEPDYGTLLALRISDARNIAKLRGMTTESIVAWIKQVLPAVLGRALHLEDPQLCHELFCAWHELKRRQVGRRAPPRRRLLLQARQPSRNDAGKQSGEMQTNLYYLRSEPLERLVALRWSTRGISLFSGAGGFDLGFLQGGLDPAVMVEWDKDCCYTLRANLTKAGIEERWGGYGAPKGWYPEFMKKRIRAGTWRDPVIMQRDITTVSTDEILDAGGFKVGEPLFVIGGPPCQGFSHAGMRIIDDPRNRLYKEFARVIGEAYPRFFIMENVPGLVTMDKGRVMRQVAEDLARCGYMVQWQLFNCANYGVPQRRIRMLCFGWRNDVMVMPEEGRMQLHFGGASGPVYHPDWFVKRNSKFWNGDKCSVEERTLHFNDGKGESYEDRLEVVDKFPLPTPTHASPEKIQKLREMEVIR